MAKPTKQQEKILKEWQEAEKRIIAKIKARMLDLSKDKELKEKMLKELGVNNKT